MRSSDPTRPWLGIVADDVTGATDVAGYVTRAGAATVQYFDLPGGVDHVDAECVVVAMKTRSVSAEEAVRRSREAARWLESLGVEHVYFKYCSTFDSTRAGNIGPVADALATDAGVDRVVIAPSAPENGRTVYRSRLFVHDQLLEESPLKDHPLNPMRRSDLRVLLGEQSRLPVGSVALPTVRAGVEAVEAELAAMPYPLAHVVADAVGDDDLDTWGRVAAARRFSTGSAGLAAAIVRARVGDVRRSALPELPVGATGIVSGSCSAATREQVASFTRTHRAFLVDPMAVSRGDDVIGQATAYVEGMLSAGRTPLVYSTTDPAQVAAVQGALGVERAAALVEDALSAVARVMVDRGVRRLVVAGGETSGAVVAALGPDGIRIGPEVAPGVPWTVTTDDAPIALLLKSGNFGDASFFTTAEEWT